MRRCYRCHGQKKIQGIGWIDIDCPVCNGIGITDKQPTTATIQVALGEVMPKVEDVIAEEVPSRAKRGRRAKEFVL